MRRTIVLACLASLLLVTVAPANSAVRTRWVRRAGKELRSVAVANDGSVYVAGVRRTGITVAATLIKYRPNGSKAWSRSWLPDPHASTHGMAVDVAPNGQVAWIGLVQAQCEGGGWFLETVTPGGALLDRYVTPGWECSIAEAAFDVAAGNDLIVVAGLSHGCCANPYRNGWVRGFSEGAAPRWKTNFEPPPTTPTAWFDRATGVDIGPRGAVYATGWAAKEAVHDEVVVIRGTPVLMKLSANGNRLFSKRIRVPMPAPDLPVSVAVTGRRVMVTAGIRGRGVHWVHPTGSDGWVGAFSKTGVLGWSRTWDTGGERAAVPAAVAIGPGQVTWVVGTRRDVAGRDLDLFIRRFAPGGALLDATSKDGGQRNLSGSGVAVAASSDGYVTGYIGRPFDGSSGRLWRVAR